MLSKRINEEQIDQRLYKQKKKGQNIKSQFKTSIDRNILKAWSNNV